jgi:hypothetical protein
MASFMKQIVLIALVSALPTFTSLGGGHSSGGASSGGASSGGASSGGASGGHSSGGSNSGHSSSGANGGHSSSASKGGHSASDPSAAPVATVGGRSVAGTSVRLGANGNKPVPRAHMRHFSTGYVPGDWQVNDDLWRRRHRHNRFFFGLFP